MSQSDVLKQEIKKQLKNRKITYQNLGEALGVSEATIKRNLNQEDLSVERLFAILDVLGISLKEIADSQDFFSYTDEHLTLEQENFFVANPRYYAFFYLLVFKFSVNDIKARYQVSDADIETYLDGLANIGVLKRMGEHGVKIFKNPQIWAPNSPLREKYTKATLANMGARLQESGVEIEITKLFINSRMLRMSPQSYAEFQQEVHKTLSFYIQKGHVEMKTVNSKDLVDVWFLFACENFPLYEEILAEEGQDFL